MRAWPRLPVVRILRLLLPAVLLLTPSVEASAQWVEAPGTGWLHVQAVHHRTDTRFDPSGDREPLFNQDSKSITTTLRLSGALGLVRGMDVWADVAMHHLQFNDAVRDRSSTGLGDVRVFARVGPSLVGLDALPVAVAVRGGVKLPGSRFPVDAEIIPLTDGQRDAEVMLEIGRSLHPWPVYVQAWGGYRWRGWNDANGRKPGDERFLYAAVGGRAPDAVAGGRVSAKLAVDAVFGTAPERRFAAFTVPLPNDVREWVQVLPTVAVDVGPGAVEVGARIPVHGKNVPAGPALTLGYFITWDRGLWQGVW